MKCGRCKEETKPKWPEFCWYCGDILCEFCYEVYGLCIHSMVEEMMVKKEPKKK